MVTHHPLHLRALFPRPGIPQNFFMSQKCPVPECWLYGKYLGTEEKQLNKGRSNYAAAGRGKGLGTFSSKNSNQNLSLGPYLLLKVGVLGLFPGMGSPQC